MPDNTDPESPVELSKIEPAPQEIIDSVLAFLNAKSWRECKRLVEANRDKLFTGAANQFFTTLLNQYRGEARLVEHIKACQEVLVRCRHESFEVAFSEHLALESLQENIDKQPDLPHRLALVREALTWIDRKQMPELWANSHLFLARNLAPSLGGDQASNTEQAITHLQMALEVFTREAFPEKWAQASSNLGAFYAERVYGEKTENIELTIKHTQAALEVYTQEVFPEEWAGTIHNLGAAYKERTLGDHPENLELTIDYYLQSLEVYTYEAFPDRWAQIQYELGHLYRNRVRGLSVDNFKRSIEHFLSALKVLTRNTSPEEWARTHLFLANTYLACNDAIYQGANLEQASKHARFALQVFTRERYPIEWAEAQKQLGISYAERDQGEQPDNLEQAIKYYHQALEVFTLQDEPEEWARLQYNLAKVYRNYTRGNRADNVEKAIACCLQALKVRTHEALPEQWAMTHNELGLAYQERIRGERADNIEQAIEHFQLSLQIWTPETSLTDWVRVQNNLGWAYQERIHGERADNIERAIAYYERALNVRIQQAAHDKVAMIENNLGGVYMLRIRGERADNIELAITHFQRVVEIQPRDTLPTRWAHTMSNLGSAYLSRIYGKQADNLGQAINYLQLSAEVLTCEDFPYSWANIQERLGDVYVKYNVGQPADNINQVTIHYQNALEVYTNMELPVKYRDTLNTIGNVYFEKRYWKDAYAAYNKAIDTSEAVFAEAYTEKGRQKEINQISQLYVRTAYCLLHLGEPAKALLLLEQGKVRLITEALALDSARLAALPQTQQQFIQVMRRTVHELEAEQRLPSGTPARRTNAELGDLLRQARTSLHQSIETIRTNYPESIFVGLDLPKTLALVPTGGALIVPMVTSQGSAVFVLPHGLEEITTDHVIWLNAFNEGELQHISVGTEIEQGWLLTYLTESLTEWIAGIETFTARIWQTLMGPIHEQLVRLGLSEGAPAIIIPQGGLGLLPLHSAWHIMDGVKRSFLDYYTVSYIPSANILSVCQQRAQDVQRHQHTLLEVIDPTADLLCTSVEGAAVGALFGSNASRIFIGNEATKEAVIAEIKEANYNYLHFSCHGFYNWGEDVMGSGLMLAGSNLTLSEIVSPEFNLHSTRLVTLSACESGLTEALELPDEYIGLPTGFLQAGAPAVVSTLWAVNDFSTALLMQEFYHRYLVEGQTIAQALRSAQLWLRQTTAEDLELAKYWEQIYQASGKTNVDAFRAMRYYQARPNDRPFSHPYYWAAFMHIGV